jgi:hypothetical protein
MSETPQEPVFTHMRRALFQDGREPQGRERTREVGNAEPGAAMGSSLRNIVKEVQHSLRCCANAYVACVTIMCLTDFDSKKLGDSVKLELHLFKSYSASKTWNLRARICLS